MSPEGRASLLGLGDGAFSRRRWKSFRRKDIGGEDERVE